MIFKGKNLILRVQKAIVDETGKSIQRNIGAIYQGTQLVWRTIYNAIKSCFGSGTWLGDKLWSQDDSWKYN